MTQLSTSAIPGGFTEKTARVNGVTLNYAAGGTGPALVLLHGYPQTWYMWRKVMPALAGHYTVIAPDLRGSGGSDAPAAGYPQGEPGRRPPPAAAGARPGRPGQRGRARHRRHRGVRLRGGPPRHRYGAWRSSRRPRSTRASTSSRR